jgi:hypothetical protein
MAWHQSFGRLTARAPRGILTPIWRVRVSIVLEVLAMFPGVAVRAIEVG